MASSKIAPALPASIARKWTPTSRAETWQGKKLQLTHSYVHLGYCTPMGFSQSPHSNAMQHRPQKRLLLHRCLSREVKLRLAAQGPLASLLLGAGLWDVSHRATASKASEEAVMNFYRQCVRPMCSVSCRGLNNEEVCQLIGGMPPNVILRHHRTRLSVSVASLVDYFVKLCSHRSGLIRRSCFNFRDSGSKL